MLGPVYSQQCEQVISDCMPPKGLILQKEGTIPLATITLSPRWGMHRKAPQGTLYTLPPLCQNVEMSVCTQ
jgi:hypothetical protein